MPPYTPLHDRPPNFSTLPHSNPSLPSPRYASPDLDLSKTMSDEQPPHTGSSSTNGKRPRREDENTEEIGEDQTSSRNGKRPREDVEAEDEGGEEVPIPPSFFGIAPRNEFTRVVGEFIMEYGRARQNVEIEMKLGTLSLASEIHGQGSGRRIRMPTKCETIMPLDYPVGTFFSNMTRPAERTPLQSQHTSLNNLLNHATEVSAQSPRRIHFQRAQTIDTFHGGSQQTGRVRVSTDRSGNLVECIRKQRIADLNIYSPREQFDWRVSLSVEEPCEVPNHPSKMRRDKDRACYRSQVCQVDLTVVTTPSNVPDAKPTITFELEIEILDVPTLLAEGEKEEQGLPSRFDEILQSCLDTVRMLIRNVG
ncbi:polynucleotide 5'-triphosphatase, partial [Tremellales sp. Uapishka_1]